MIALGLWGVFSMESKNSQNTKIVPENTANTTQNKTKNTNQNTAPAKQVKQVKK